MKKLWLLELHDTSHYDIQESCVVRSTTSIAARHIAAEYAGAEGREVWLDAAKSSCTQIKVEDHTQMIHRHFSAG